MKLPTRERINLPAISTRSDRGQVIDCSDPSALRSVVRRTSTPSSSDHHWKAEGAAAVLAVEEIIVWTISVLLTAIFLIAGASHRSDPSGISGGLSQSSNAALSCLFVRAVEISGAVMLLIPRCASVGAVGLAAMMAGVVGKHLAHNESTAAIVPSVLLALLAIIAYARWPRHI